MVEAKKATTCKAYRPERKQSPRCLSRQKNLLENNFIMQAKVSMEAKTCMKKTCLKARFINEANATTEAKNASRPLSVEAKNNLLDGKVHL